MATTEEEVPKVEENKETPAAAAATTAEENPEAGDGDGGAAEEEECQAEFQPLVQLNEVDTKTGEEDEDVEYKARAKLFRFSKEENAWKERGTGDVKILKNKESKRMRLLMRREKTYKICMNHFVNVNVELNENIGSDRSWVWETIDYADNERDDCVLAIRFSNSTIALEFKEAYDKARQQMKELVASEEAAETKAAAETKEKTTTEATESTSAN